MLAARRARRLELADLVPLALLGSYLLLILTAPVPPHGDATEFTQRPFVLVYAVFAVWTAAGFAGWLSLYGLRQRRVWLPLLIAAAFTVMTAIPSASAADLAARPYTKAPMAEVYNWTGFYIGGNAGYSWGRSRTDASYFNNTTNLLLATGTSSFDMNRWVAGVPGPRARTPGRRRDRPYRSVRPCRGCRFRSFSPPWPWPRGPHWNRRRPRRR